MRHTRLHSPLPFPWGISSLLILGVAVAGAQSPVAPPPSTVPVPQGQVIIESHGEPPDPGRAPVPLQAPQQPVVDAGTHADITDAQRSALLITRYDLDTRLNLPQSGLSARARLTVRNTGADPLSQLALQISSTLHWDSATLVDGSSRTKLALAQHQLETDADHTGAETEAVLPLPAPLSPGQAVDLDLFYSGTISSSAARLQRLGANQAQQLNTDWDVISPSWTGLRGFGNVLWYPVAAPQLFFADGNTLFEQIGRTRLREQHANITLRLSVEYTGSAPAAAYFCGRRQGFHTTPDDPDAPTAVGTGIATVSFPTEPLGFRTPSLFLLPLPETLLAAGASAATSAPPLAGQTPPSSAPQESLVALETTDPGTAAALTAATDRVSPLLREWLGPRPLSVLTVLDHNGQPFQDGPLLVAPVATLETSPAAQALIGSLTHAWVQSGQPWIDEGIAQFFGLLWTERNQGHDAANAQLDELTRPLALIEPTIFTDAAATPGQPLTSAYDEIYYRRKAAAVWWMLRGLVGDGTLHQALEAWRVQPPAQSSAAQEALALQHLLEHLSGKDLGWFFADWVLRDRGLPDLTITDLNAAAEPAGAGHPAGWLVAVTVRNGGAAAAEVPLIVRSGTASPVEQRIHIAGLATVTQRVLVEATPTSVQVNDGSTPEQQQSQHTRSIQLETR